MRSRVVPQTIATETPPNALPRRTSLLREAAAPAGAGRETPRTARPALLFSSSILSLPGGEAGPDGRGSADPTKLRTASGAVFGPLEQIRRAAFSQMAGSSRAPAQ